MKGKRTRLIGITLALILGFTLLLPSAGDAARSSESGTSEVQYERITVRGPANSVLEAAVKVTLYHGFVIQWYNAENGELNTNSRWNVLRGSALEDVFSLFFLGTTSTSGNSSSYGMRVISAEEETDLLLFPDISATNMEQYETVRSEFKDILSQIKATVEGDTYVSIDEKIDESTNLFHRKVGASSDVLFRRLVRGLRAEGLVVAEESIKNGFIRTFYSSPRGKNWEISMTCVVFPAARGKSTLLAGYQVRNLDLPKRGSERKEAYDKAMKEIKQTLGDMMDNIQAAAEGRSTETPKTEELKSDQSTPAPATQEGTEVKTEEKQQK